MQKNRKQKVKNHKLREVVGAEQGVSSADLFNSIMFTLKVSFVNIVMNHTLLRGIRQLVSSAYFRYFPELSSSFEFDKNTYLSVLRGFFVMFWIFALIYIYYSVLSRYLNDDQAYYAVNFLTLAIAGFWDLNYVVFEDRNTFIPRTILLELAKISYLFPYVLGNMHIGFITGFFENIGPFFITLYWNHISSLAKTYCRNKEERKVVFNKISSFSSLGHTLVGLPMMVLLLGGLVTFTQLSELSYRTTYILVLVNVAARYVLVEGIRRIDPLYDSRMKLQTQKRIEENELKKDSSCFDSLLVVFYNPILRSLFVSNIFYFTISAILETLSSSIITKFAFIHCVNVSSGKRDLLVIMLTYMRQNLASKYSDNSLFMKEYKDSCTQLFNLFTSFFTGLISGSIIHALDWCDRNLETNPYLKRLVGEDNSDSDHSSRLTILTIKLLSLIGIIEFTFGTCLYFNLIGLNVFGLLQVFISTGLVRSLKYNQLDPWRQEVFATCIDDSIRDVGVAGVDMYAPRFSKGIILSTITIIAETTLQQFETDRKAGAYAYEQSAVYLPINLLVSYVWLLQHKELLSLVSKTECKKHEN